MAATTPSQFRFDERTLAEIDQLKDKFGLTTRSDVIRMAVRRMYGAEIGEKPLETGKRILKKKKKDG